MKELEKHNKKQKRLREIGEYNKNKTELATHEDKLKEVSKSINEIKSVIGSRLKL